MAQTRTAKGTAIAKASGTTLTIPNISMVGGDTLTVAVGYQSTDNAAPSVLDYGGNDLTNDLMEGKTFTTGGFRMRVYSTIIQNTKTRDLELEFTNATAARAMIALSSTQTGKVNITNDNENIASTLSTTGGALPLDHISTMNIAFHMTNGPAGDAIGSSSTGHTLGQRTGTTGDTDTSNITIQETYKIITAATVQDESIITGDSYQIKTVGTTNWIAIGAVTGTVGEQFVATGAGSGTGEAYHLESVRSRITGLATRDHIGIMGHLRPKQTFTIEDIVQHGRNMNENPYWVEMLIEDESGRGFWINIDPDDYRIWSDAAITDKAEKYAAIWVKNIIDSNLIYVEDTALTDRFADLIGAQLIL